MPSNREIATGEGTELAAWLFPKEPNSDPRVSRRLDEKCRGVRAGGEF